MDISVKKGERGTTTVTISAGGASTTGAAGVLVIVFYLLLRWARQGRELVHPRQAVQFGA